MHNIQIYVILSAENASYPENKILPVETAQRCIKISIYRPNVTRMESWGKRFLLEEFAVKAFLFYLYIFFFFSIFKQWDISNACNIANALLWDW